MAADRVRIGVIGVGQIGKHHLENYAKLPGAEVVALADIDAAELGRVATAHGITDTYTDFRKLLARDDIEAVDVCLHNNLHAPVTIAALQAGKNVYCEKPMAGSYGDAEAMLAAARETGRKLSHPAAHALRAARRTPRRRSSTTAGWASCTTPARRASAAAAAPSSTATAAATFVQKRSSRRAARCTTWACTTSSQSSTCWATPRSSASRGKTYQEIDMDEARRRSSGYNVEELGLGFVRLAGGMTLDIIEGWAILLDGIEGSAVVGSKGGVRLSPFGFFQSAGPTST